MGNVSLNLTYIPSAEILHVLGVSVTPPSHPSVLHPWPSVLWSRKRFPWPKLFLSNWCIYRRDGNDSAAINQGPCIISGKMGLGVFSLMVLKLVTNPHWCVGGEMGYNCFGGEIRELAIGSAKVLTNRH